MKKSHWIIPTLHPSLQPPEGDGDGFQPGEVGGGLGTVRGGRSGPHLLHVRGDSSVVLDHSWPIWITRRQPWKPTRRQSSPESCAVSSCWRPEPKSCQFVHTRRLDVTTHNLQSQTRVSYLIFQCFQPLNFDSSWLQSRQTFSLSSLSSFIRGSWFRSRMHSWSNRRHGPTWRQSLPENRSVSSYCRSEPKSC